MEIIPTVAWFQPVCCLLCVHCSNQNICILSSLPGSIQVLLRGGSGIFKFWLIALMRQQKHKNCSSPSLPWTMQIVPWYLCIYNEDFSVLLILLSYNWLFKELEKSDLGAVCTAFFPTVLLLSWHGRSLWIIYPQLPSRLIEAADFGKWMSTNTFLWRIHIVLFDWIFCYCLNYDSVDF